MDDFDLTDLPDELQDRADARSGQDPAEAQAARDELLAKLGEDIAAKRDKAVSDRKESGLEAIWQACEEAYLGIDDSNRVESTGGKWVKPTSLSGPVTTPKDNEATGSTAFVLLTSHYVDMGAAKVCEIALPIDDKAFSFEPEPVPELILQKDDTTPAIDPATGQQMMAPPDPAAPPAAPQPGQPPADPSAPPAAPTPKPLTVGDIAQQKMDAARESVEQAEKRVWDWMTECGYPAEMRTVIHDAARIGVGVIKGPFPKMLKTRAMSKSANGLKLTITQKPTLASKWIDAWNLFPDGACGEDIHSGEGIFERDFISRSTLKRLKRDKDSLGVPIYIPGQIDKVLKEGPDKCSVEGANPNLVVNKDRFTIWYFTGTVKLSDMKLMDAVGMDEMPDDIDEVYAVITMVNDTVIRATINPLESGSFPYRALPWTHRSGSWAGRGIGEQVAMPQRMVNAATRALLNNAGVSSGSQIIIDPVGLVPADGSSKITPLKIWHRTADATTDDVRKLFVAVDIPNQGEKLMQIIQYGMKLAEDASSIPLISQGKTGETSPQTFGQAELQNNNANALLRGIGMRLDDYITDPLVNDYYEMLLLDPDVPDSEKGNARISANGTMAMVEKAIQEQTMLQAANLTANPAFGIDPKKWFAEYWKSKRLDPRKIQYTPEELAAQQQQQAPPPPVVQAAQIRAKSATDVVAAKVQGELQLSQQNMEHEQQQLQTGGMTPHMASASARVEAERIRAASAQAIESSRSSSEAAYAQTEAQIARDNAHARLEELALKRDLAILEYTSKHNLTIEQTKAMLAKTAMQEQTKRQLAQAGLALDGSHRNADRALDLHKHTNPNLPAGNQQDPTDPEENASADLASV